MACAVAARSVRTGFPAPIDGAKSATRQMKSQTPVPTLFEPQIRLAGQNPVLMLLLSPILFSISATAQIPFTYTNDNGHITITKYTGDGGALIIPDTIDGLPVTRIGDSAFYEASGLLSSVIIPNSVTSIGESAFRSCFGLTNVIIGSGVTTIGDSAFASSALNRIVVPDNVVTIGNTAFLSSALTTAVIGDGVTTIGQGAFAFCSGLKNITIGQSVTNIGGMAFGYCTSLEGVYFKGDAFQIRSQVFEHFEKTIIYYLAQTKDWGPTFDGRKTVLWNPTVATNDAAFGFKAGQFGFTITGTANVIVVVERSSALSNPFWTPVATNVLVSGSSQFVDSSAMEESNRIYRLRSP
jgi:hypothetical protein